MAALLSCALLYITSMQLIKFFHLQGLSPSFTVLFTLKTIATGKLKSFSQMAIFISLGLPVLSIGGFAWALFWPKKRELHGSARFANNLELTKAGLLIADKPDDQYPSILIGKLGKKYLYFRGQQFMYLAAPTRSGKGVGIVIPNCLHYRDSMVILDIKGENYDITAGFRAKCGQAIYKFAPDAEDGDTAAWNALSYVRDDPKYRLSDLMSIASILYPPKADDVWSTTAQNLFLGIALYIMETAYEKEKLNISTIKRYASSLPFLKDVDTFDEYVATRKFYEPLSDDCIEFLRKYAETSSKVRNSISISFDAPLMIFSDPIVANATAKSTFDLREVRKQRMSIYVVIKPSSIEKFSVFLNLFFQQLLMLNMAEQPPQNPELKYQCLLMLDEFTAMGRVGIIEKSSAFMASYNMRLLLIFQSKSQIEDKRLYDVTGARTMLTNMACQVIYAPRDDHDAKDYSEMIGYMTEKGISKSRQLTGKTGRSQSESDQRRAVLLPQEVKSIGIDKEIISLENMPPALVEKIIWYKDEAFIARANLPLPVSKALLIEKNHQFPENHLDNFIALIDETELPYTPINNNVLAGLQYLNQTGVL